MRPTELGIKAPFNKTPAARCPVLTHTGHNVQLARSTSGFTFKSQPRFPNYAVEAKKLGFRIGPGAYDLSQTSRGVPRVAKVPQYKKTVYSKSFHPDGFYYSGNLLVYDNTFLLKSARAKARSTEHTLATQPDN